jgi:alcohol dehydrogenase (NADP+)
MPEIARTDSVDPVEIPQRTLWTGVRMPAIGLGTFGSDHAPARDVAAAVRYAAEVGYRHFDCASVYGNEREIGAAFTQIFRDLRIRREELWVTSKLWNDRHAEDAVIPSCRESLSYLRLDYLDLYLVHWPFPNYHPPHCDVSSRSPNAQPYVHENFMKTWRRMEELVDRGIVRHIGTSNMTIPKLELLLRDARIRPVVNEMELHPHFQQPNLFDLVRSHGIEPVGYSPLGSPARPERDRVSTDTVDLEDPVIIKIARRHHVHPAAVCIRWAVQRGQAPIPFSIKPAHILSNLQAAIRPTLSSEEMMEIASIDRNCRLIKGQVFLWREGQSWEDLWDPDGRIAT